MFVEEATIIFDLLRQEKNKKVLNVCSSDERFWKVQQPYIWENLLEPLLEGKNEITHLDMKASPGVDIVNDCANMVDVPDNSFDIVLFTSGVEHIINVQGALDEIKRVLKPEGTLLASAPGVYPKHDDPIDTLLRLPELEDWKTLLGDDWEIDAFEKTNPIPANPAYNFEELVYATIVKARPILNA